MKCESQTEVEMDDATAPTPPTADELMEYIGSLADREHDYGTCVYAMSLAATAAFNYMAGKLGVTGFQASCADLDVIRRTRMIVGPFALFCAHDMVYPQYDLRARLETSLAKWKPWAATEARKKLAEADGAHPNVVAHWRRLDAECPAADTPAVVG